MPKLNSDNPDAGYTALVAKLNAAFLAWNIELINLYYLKLPERCPATLLDELGDMVSAGLYQYDSERTKRSKIAIAVQSHKIRGTWTASVKPYIDSTTGYDARLINGQTYKKALNIWVECDGSNDVGTSWAPNGSGDVAGYLGLKESVAGGASSLEIAGIVYIDLHYGVYTAVLSAETIAKLVNDLSTDVVPAYCQCNLSYINTSGNVTVYAGGVIG